MQGEMKLGFYIGGLDNSFKRASGRRLAALEAEFGLTPVNNWVLGFVEGRTQKGRDVFQRDIETAMNIRRSTATGILQLMEKNGLITRVSVPEDARLKKIVLTQRGHEACDRAISIMEQVDGELAEGITPEDLQAFRRVAERIKQNEKSMK